VGKSAALAKRDQWREKKLVMLKVDDDGREDLEGNESVWLEGKVG
jgi:glycine cleavage system aminomethyltransferase T